jgi:hypothetical protein
MVWDESVDVELVVASKLIVYRGRRGDGRRFGGKAEVLEDPTDPIG